MTPTAKTGWRAMFKAVHYPLLWLIVLCLMLNWGVGYRALLYINFFGLLIYGLANLRISINQLTPLSYGLLAVPLIFTFLHWTAVGHIEIIKEIRQLWLAVFLVISFWAYNKHRTALARWPWTSSLMVMLVIFTLTQVIAMSIFGKPYGTNKNPHYLAFYCSIALIVAAYLFNRVSMRWRAVIVLMFPVLGYLLLSTSSRPAWLALVAAALVALLFSKLRSKRYLLLALIVIPTLLFAGNVGQFGSRLSELVQDIDHEERVVIWQNAWQMQKSSAPSQWIWGHGLDSFQEDFTHYSAYKSIVNFNSPHNSAFELLYISGISGLACFIFFYLLLAMRLLRISRQPHLVTDVAAIIAILVFNLLFISITIPLFTSYNLYMLAIMTGCILSLGMGAAKDRQ